MSSTPGHFKPKHCFWRTPEARPYRGIDAKFAPDEILAAWGRKTKVDAKGETSQEGSFSGLRLETALKLAFVVVGKDGDELDEDDAWGIARQTLRHQAVRLGGEKPITPADFIREADKLATAFFQQPEKEYVFVTSLSVASLPTKKLQIGGCTVRPLKTRKKYRVPALVSSGSVWSVYQKHVEQTRYKWVAVTTKGRTPNDAFNRAYEAVALLRALWTFAGTFGSMSLRFGALAPQPLAAVHQGPIQTLHHRNGDPVSDEYFWREQDPREDRQLFDPSSGWAKLEGMRQKLSRRIGRLPYGRDLEQLLLRYVAALDHTNHDVLMLQVWSILERITNLVGARYDELIEMASWIMPDRRLWKQLISGVRLQRNRYVHSSKSAPDADQVAYLAKYILEIHLLALVHNYLKVRSLTEYAEMLALPTEPATLAERKRRLEVALRFHTPKPPKRPANT